MSALRRWNTEQVHVFRRICALYRVALTPELVARLAARYAAKHANERSALRTL